jgi:plastocyanin
MRLLKEFGSMQRGTFAAGSWQGRVTRFGAAIAVAAAAVVLAPVFPTSAADETEITLTIKDHKFDPAEIKVPAGKPIKLTVKNLDATAEEFESHPLAVEKVVSGQGTIVVRIKPLTKGSYKFFGEYHEATAQGMLIAE